MGAAGSTSPAIAVVVPTRDRAEKVDACLRSLQQQTLRGFHVVVVNDGSQDETADTLQRWQTRHLPFQLTVLTHDTPRGANPSRNAAVQQITAPLIAFLDDDCTADPGWLAALRAGFTAPGIAAVTGDVEDAPPQNGFDLALKGTCKVPGRPHARRLVAGNMAVRRDVLRQCHLDEDRAAPASDMQVSARGDEEGLYLEIKRAGYEVHMIPAARVVHHHHYNLRAFARQAFRSGSAAAILGNKYQLAPRWELLALATFYLLAAVSLILRTPVTPRLSAMTWFAALAALMLFQAAIIYNELVLKQKSVWETVRALPWLMLYYHLRTAGYLVTAAGRRPWRRESQEGAAGQTTGSKTPHREPARITAAGCRRQ